VFRIKIIPDNTASGIRAVYSEYDDPMKTSGEEHVFQFDLTGVPSDGNFHELIKPLSDILFSQGVALLAPGDGVQNPGLFRVMVQNVFGVPESLNVEIDYLRIRSIPEPTTWALVALGAAGMGARLRRRMF
jgi:hypothetical protein